MQCAFKKKKKKKKKKELMPIHADIYIYKKKDIKGDSFLQTKLTDPTTLVSLFVTIRNYNNYKNIGRCNLNTWIFFYN